MLASLNRPPSLTSTNDGTIRPAAPDRFSESSYGRIVSARPKAANSEHCETRCAARYKNDARSSYEHSRGVWAHRSAKHSNPSVLSDFFDGVCASFAWSETSNWLLVHACDSSADIRSITPTHSGYVSRADDGVRPYALACELKWISQTVSSISNSVLEGKGSLKRRVFMIAPR